MGFPGKIQAGLFAAFITVPGLLTLTAHSAETAAGKEGAAVPLRQAASSPVRNYSQSETAQASISSTIEQGARPEARQDRDQGTTYQVRPGDLLEISIWKEADMRRETLVLPDGTISYPLAGHTRVAGLTPREIEQHLNRRLSSYFKDPFISVIVKRTSGNQVYIVGQVRNPGVFTITQPVDVMQALSLAGGLSEFADKGEIIVLRRLESGEQQVIRFAYSSVQRGKKLSSNIILESGDTVVVPEKGLF